MFCYASRMKSVFSIFLAASLVSFTPQIAEACHGVKQFSRQSIAFADVMFEGRLKEIVETPRFTELTFDVGRVIRGDLEQDEITIGWRRSFGFGDMSIESFVKMFGETTRIAMSTPPLADKFCKLEMRHGNYIDEESGELVSKERLQPICRGAPLSLEYVFRENIPFVLSNGRCGTSYLYSVQKYEKMRNYDKNLAAFEQAIADGSQVSSSEFFIEKVGEFGPLPWNGFSSRARDITGTLFREQSGFFTPSLRTNAAWQASLLDLAVEMLEDKSVVIRTKFANDEGAREKFRESMRTEILTLLDYMEKDPEYRDRLLQDD